MQFCCAPVSFHSIKGRSCCYPSMLFFVSSFLSALRYLFKVVLMRRNKHETNARLKLITPSTPAKIVLVWKQARQFFLCPWIVGKTRCFLVHFPLILRWIWFLWVLIEWFTFSKEGCNAFFHPSTAAEKLIIFCSTCQVFDITNYSRTLRVQWICATVNSSLALFPFYDEEGTTLCCQTDDICFV